jgi:hypothetical protein
MKRKDFIIIFGRGCFLFALVALIGYVLVKRSQGPTEYCEIDRMCGNCKSFSDCKKPQAQKQRKDGQE